MRLSVLLAFLRRPSAALARLMGTQNSEKQD
jgi:hypothetical protein